MSGFGYERTLKNKGNHDPLCNGTLTGQLADDQVKGRDVAAMSV
jgi:hypothetical protein